MGAQRVVGTVSHQHIYGMLFRIFWPLVSGGVSADKSADYWEQLERKLSPETTLVTGPAHLMRLPAAANFVAESHAVDARHHDVAEHEIEFLSVRIEELQRFFGIRREHRVIAQFLQKLGGEFSHFPVVLDHEDPAFRDR